MVTLFYSASIRCTHSVIVSFSSFWTSCEPPCKPDQPAKFLLARIAGELSWTAAKVSRPPPGRGTHTWTHSCGPTQLESNPKIKAWLDWVKPSRDPCQVSSVRLSSAQHQVHQQRCQPGGLVLYWKREMLLLLIMNISVLLCDDIISNSQIVYSLKWHWRLWTANISPFHWPTYHF